MAGANGSGADDGPGRHATQAADRPSRSRRAPSR